MSDGSSNGNIIESDSERLSDHSGDDSNESVEIVVKDSAEIETDHIEGYCEEVLGLALKKELIKQIVSSLPPSTRLQCLQFFNKDLHLVLQTDFNDQNDIESDLVDFLINLKEWVQNKDEIISYLSYMQHMVTWLKKLQIPVPIKIPLEKIELMPLSGILQGYFYNQIPIPPHSWCETHIGQYISSSDVSMESVPDEDSHSEQRPQEDDIKVTVDDIGEDIEADQSNQFHCDQCNQYFVLKEHLDKHENEVHCTDKEPSDNAEDNDPDSVKTCDDIVKEPSDSASSGEVNLSDGRKNFSCQSVQKVIFS